MTVLITGGSSGIGRAAATMFARRGAIVYEMSRRESSDQDGVIHIRGDVTDPDDRCRAVKSVLSARGNIDVLVNNAGTGSFGSAETERGDIIRRQFEVNFFAAVEMTRLVLPSMREHGSGRIINVCSLAAYFPLPFQSYYSASKAALENWSRAISGELSAFNIFVTCICPGDTQTCFTAARIAADRPSDFGDSPQEKSRNVYENAVNRAYSKVFKSETRGQSPEKVAAEIVRFAGDSPSKSGDRPPLVAIPGFGDAWIDRLARLLPRSWVSRLICRFYV